MPRFDKEGIISDWPREDGTSIQNFILFRIYLQTSRYNNYAELEVVWINDDKSPTNPNAWIRSKMYLN